MPGVRGADGSARARDPDADGLTSLVVWREHGGRATIARALTPGERSKLEVRVAALEGALTPFDEADYAAVESAIGAMFSGFRSMRQTNADMEATVLVTRHALRKFPAWAVQEACEMIASHETSLDPHWPPSDGEIADVVRAVVRSRDAALAKAKEVLGAVVDAPAQRPAPPARQLPPPPLDGARAEALRADLEARKVRNAKPAERLP